MEDDLELPILPPHLLIVMIRCVQPHKTQSCFFLPPMLVSRVMIYNVTSHLPVRKSLLAVRITRPSDESKARGILPFGFFPPVDFREKVGGCGLKKI